MQHLTGDQFNGETALRVANFPRYTCMIVNRVTYFLSIGFMMNYLNFKFFYTTLVALRKNILIFARNSLCLLNNICSSVLKLCVRSVNVSFFSFDFLINTWYFFISRNHCYHNTCRCMFVCFLFCLFWNFEETREKTLFT